MQNIPFKYNTIVGVASNWFYYHNGTKTMFSKWGAWREVEKLRIQEPHSAKRFMKLVLKINEVDKGEGTLSLRCATCQGTLEELWTK